MVFIIITTLRMFKLKLVPIVFSVGFLFIPGLSQAHPGNTASDGCHYCRTNCEKWGEVEGARHCHNAPAPEPAYVAPTPAPTPVATTYSEGQYNSIVAEKDNLAKEVAGMAATLVTLEGKDKESASLASTVDALTKENEDLKNGEALSAVSGELEKSKALSQSLRQKLDTLDQPRIENDEGSNGWLAFLFGGGAVYGAQKLRGRKDIKKEGVMIKGNITRDGQKIFYTPDSRYYDMVKVDTSKGERWFADASEASAAGWHDADAAERGTMSGYDF